jgi:hypothetical protein
MLQLNLEAKLTTMKTYQKSAVILMSSIFIFLQHSFCQLPDGSTYENYIQQKYSYYDSLISTNSELSGTGYKEFRHFWLNTREAVLHDGDYDTTRYYQNDAKSFSNNSSKSTGFWNEIGPSNTPLIYNNTSQNRRQRGTGRIYQIEIDAQNNRVFACSPTGGLFYSDDYGQNWNNAGTDYLLRTIGVGTFQVAKNSNNGDTWFIATGGGEEEWDNFGGLYRTTNAGNDWEDISQGLPSKYASSSQIRTLLISPTDENVLFAIFKTGVYKTTNALTANSNDIVWELVLENGNSPDFGGNGYFFDARFKPDDASTIVISGEQLFISTQDGNQGTFSLVQGYVPDPNRRYKSIVRFSESVPNKLYFLAQRSNHHKLYSYDFLSGSLSMVNSFVSSGRYWRKHGFAVNPNNSNELIFMNVGQFYRSVDGGTTINADNSVYRDYHDDIHWIMYNSDGSELWLGTDGGISMTSDNGLSWNQLSSGLGVAIYYSMGQSERLKRTVLGGGWDTGTNLLAEGESEFYLIQKFGDSFESKVDDSDLANPIYYLTTQTTLSKTSDGFTIQNITPPVSINYTGWITNAYDKNYFDQKTLYFGGSESMGRFNELTNNWESISFNVDANNSSKLFASTVSSRADGDYLFAATADWQTYALDGFELYMSSNANDIASSVTWQNITPLDPNTGQQYQNKYFGRIATDEEIPDKLWVSFSGYTHSPKIMNYSQATWTEIQEDNLEGQSVTTVAHEFGTNDFLYVGTTNGVYYKDGSDTEWTLYDGLPHINVKELEINYCAGKIRACTYGRGIWEADLISSLEDKELAIVSDQTYAGVNDVYGHIRITNGSKLTVTGTLNMLPGAKIYVEPGSELIIDGGTITTQCGEMWQGIEVWGNTNLKQTATNQGRLTMKNGAVLTNARNAVSLMKSGDWAMSGGYVQATNSSFINNKRSVEFLAYKNIQSNGYEAANRSYFRNCVFENNDHYLAPNEGTYDMVTMYKVKGVKVLGCDFRDIRSSQNINADQGAIGTVDANFRVSSSCNIPIVMAGQTCPEADKDRNTFIGFELAIQAEGAEWNVGPEIKESDFDQNVVGIELGATIAPSVIFNHFTVGNNPTPQLNNILPNDHLAVKVEECDEYIIEENQFTGDDIYGWHTHGVYTYDPSYAANSNEIYKNDFDNISSANIASGNHADPTTETSFIGLRYVCNQNQNNTNDFEVRGYGLQNLPSEISNYQHGGTPGIPAGNTFSASTSGDGIYTHLDFYSNSAYSYLIESGQTDPLANETVITTPGSITVTTTLGTNSCATNFPEPGPVKNVSVLMNELGSKSGAYKNLFYTYLQLIDQGNTQGMLTEIDLTWPQDAWSLHSELMARSPNNSEQVLMHAAERNILSHGQLLEILLSNPDALRSGRIITYVGGSMPNPMPSYMVDLLIAAASGSSTPRAEMERQLSNLHLDFIKSHKGVLNHYLNDTVGVYHPDTLMSYFSKVKTLQGRYQQIYGYTSFGDYVSAQLVIDSVRTNYRLSSEQLSELTNSEDLVNFFETLNGAGRNTAQLNSTEVNTLRGIATKKNGGVAAKRAESILCFFYSFCLDDNGAPKSQTVKSKKPLLNLEEAKRNAIQIAVSPNPANFIVEFEYDLLLPAQANVLRIYDVQGKPIQSVSLGQEPRGIRALDTREWPNGFYVYEFLQDGEQVNSGKLVIQH